MYKVNFFDNKTLQPGLFSGITVLRDEIKPFNFSQKIYWFPTSHNTSKILDQGYSSQLIADLKNGAFLIYDICLEPGNVSWLNDLLDPLITIFKKNKISLKKLIVLSATPKSLYGDCEYSYLFFNDQLYNVVHRFKKSNELPKKTLFKKHFLSLSRKDTLVRRYINFLLHTKNLFDKGLVSHVRGSTMEEHQLVPVSSDLEIAKGDLSFIQTHNLNTKEYLKYGFKQHFLDTTDTGMENYHWLNMYNFDIHFKLSESVPLELVNETYAFGSDSLFFTEKIAKPILSKSIFLLIGNPFLLSFIKQLGFKTFPHLFDESYDKELDNVKRTSIVFKNLEDFCKIPLVDCKKIYDENMEILNYNYNHLLNTKWDFSIKSRIEKLITKESFND